jgi:hypothetical protein
MDVHVHVYDLGQGQLRAVGTHWAGAYHSGACRQPTGACWRFAGACWPGLAAAWLLLLTVSPGNRPDAAGVEVCGVEYSFGATPRGSGVFSNAPRGCSMHSYKESVLLGQTSLDLEAVRQLVERMRQEWTGTSYDLLHRVRLYRPPCAVCFFLCFFCCHQCDRCHDSQRACRTVVTSPMRSARSWVWEVCLPGSTARLTQGLRCWMARSGHERQPRGSIQARLTMLAACPDGGLTEVGGDVGIMMVTQPSIYRPRWSAQRIQPARSWRTRCLSSIGGSQSHVDTRQSRASSRTGTKNW